MKKLKEGAMKCRDITFRNESKVFRSARRWFRFRNAIHKAIRRQIYL